MQRSPYGSLFALGLAASGCASAEPASVVENNTHASDLGNVAPGPGPAPIVDMATSSSNGNDGGASLTVCDLHKLRINELSTQGAGGATDEFIELYNPCNAAVMLNGGKLVYRAAASTSDNYTLYSFTTQSVPSKGFFVVANAGFAGAADLKPFEGGSGLAAAGGGVALEDGTSAVVDSVGYGTATNSFVEASAGAAPTATQSLARMSDGADANDNATDFQLGAPTPGATN